MTSLTTPKETGRGADIPAPRGGQGVRLLVLGVDEDARLLREQAVAAGYELAQRYSARVSHVAYGAGVDPEDGRYAKIREAGLALQPISACATQLGLAPTPTVPAPTKGGSMPAKTESAPVPTPLPLPVTAPVPAPAKAESESGAGVEEVEFEPESDDFAEDDDLLDEPGGPDPLAYPPLPEEEPERDDLATFEFDDTGTDTDTDAGPDVDPDADPDEQVEQDAVGLAAAMLGADPWPGAVADTIDTHESEAVEEAEADAFGFSFEVDALDGLDALDPTDPTDPMDALDPPADAEIPDTASASASASTAVGGGPRLLVFSFVWALIPLVSFGLLTPAVFGYAAVRTRSRLYAAATLGYALTVVLAFALSATHPQTGSTAHGSDGLLTFALALSWLGGTGHALSARPRVFAARTPQPDRR